MSNQERRLMRKLANVHSGAQEARAPRGLGGPDPEYIREQQDRQRNSLAERLLEIGLEETRIGDFADCHKREPVTKEGGEVAYHEDIAILTLEEWFVKLANAAMSAAEVIYPEIPAPGGVISEQVVATHGVLPHAAQEGAWSVGGLPVERLDPTVEGRSWAPEMRADRGEG